MKNRLGDRQPFRLVALRLTDGAIMWATRTLKADVFSWQCLYGPDLDFGAAPNLFTITDPSTTQPRQVLGITKKSGDYWGLDPDDGSVVWRTERGPGGLGGGTEFGTATDGKRIYVSEANSGRQPFTFTLTGARTVRGHDRHERILVCTQPGYWRNPVADARSAGLEKSRIRGPPPTTSSMWDRR